MFSPLCSPVSDSSAPVLLISLSCPLSRSLPCCFVRFRSLFLFSFSLHLLSLHSSRTNSVPIGVRLAEEQPGRHLYRGGEAQVGATVIGHRCRNPQVGPASEAVSGAPDGEKGERERERERERDQKACARREIKVEKELHNHRTHTHTHTCTHTHTQIHGYRERDCASGSVSDLTRPSSSSTDSLARADAGAADPG